MPYKDRNKRNEKAREYNKEYYQQNHDELYKKRKARKEEIREWFSDIKEHSSCMICGENEPCCIDFHHFNDDKEAGLAQMVVNGCSKTNILIELEKTVPLCANCHRKVTRKIIELT